MKKLLILFLVIAAGWQPASGQNAFGVKAGIQAADHAKVFTPPDAEPQDQLTKPYAGYGVGVFFKARLGKQWAFAAETNFSVIGSRTQYTTPSQVMNPDGKTHYYNDKIGYIEVPLTVQYRVGKLYAGIGPSVAYKLFSKMTNFEDRTYETTFYKKLDAAANILAGYQLTERWDVNLRYSHGLLNIHENNVFMETKNRFLNVSVLYTLK
ncbi:MAG TPA: porin family protein [Chitinophagaceae bacterium]